MILMHLIRATGVLSLVLALCVSCQAPKESGELGGNAHPGLHELQNPERRFRAHLTQFLSAGYAPYEGKVTSLDIGVLEKRNGDRVECEILLPGANSRVPGFPWAPADFYTNLRTAQEQNQERARIGEPNIFFAGDDNNRNNNNQGHAWTAVPDSMLTNSMDFENKSISKPEFRFLFRFTRRGISLERQIRATVKPSNGACVAAIEICGSNGPTCAADNWKSLRQVVVHIDVPGGLRDRLRRPPPADRDRNDFQRIQLKLTHADGRQYDENIEKRAP